MVDGKIDETHAQYVQGYQDAVNNTYGPPYDDREWFLYQTGREAGLKEQRLQRLLDGKKPLRRW